MKATAEKEDSVIMSPGHAVSVDNNSAKNKAGFKHSKEILELPGSLRTLG